MTISAEVRAEIARQKTTITELAEATGISRLRLSSRLNDHQEFLPSELARIGEALGVPGWEFMRRATKEKTAA